ncbi:MAG: hypothetical protein K2X66_00455 [Cyanobacteria bacterium]|nr:hypothetical protein [Cyanobacteriota bacterium]
MFTTRLPSIGFQSVPQPAALSLQKQAHSTQKASVQSSVRFQGTLASLNRTLNTIDSDLKATRATREDKADILKLLKEFYVGEVDQAPSAQEPGYENQGAKIFNVHEAVIDANLAQVASNPFNTLHVVRNLKTGAVVATAALLQSVLNGSHQPPENAGQMSYFYQAKGVPDSVSLALVADLAERAKALNKTSLFVTTRRKGMDARNELVKAAGFQEVSDPQRINALVPPVLRSPRTVVYEKQLG